MSMKATPEGKNETKTRKNNQVVIDNFIFHFLRFRPHCVFCFASNNHRQERQDCTGRTL